MGWVEWFAVAITLAAVWLTARQVIWCWPLGMLSVALYAVVFWQARLYADMGLQGLYFALSAYGWWAWLRGGEDHGALRVSSTPVRARWLLFLLAAAGGLVLGQTLSRLTDASLPFMDSMLTSFSIAAQWMQTRKLLEAWLVWIGVDVLYVGMFLYKGLFPTAGLYALFLYLAGMGYVEWYRSMQPTEPAPGAA